MSFFLSVPRIQVRFSPNTMSSPGQRKPSCKYSMVLKWYILDSFCWDVFLSCYDHWISSELDVCVFRHKWACICNALDVHISPNKMQLSQDKENQIFSLQLPVNLRIWNLFHTVCHLNLLVKCLIAGSWFLLSLALIAKGLVHYLLRTEASIELKK